jgi:hypothetical protein
MKKGFIALAVVALASSVFAQDAPKADKAAKTFTLSGGVDAYYLNAKTVGDYKGFQHADYATTRSRPLFKVDDGSSQFCLEFELVGNMGIQPAPAGAAVDGGNGSAPASNDQTNAFRLRGMYFSSTVAGIDGLKLTGGLCPTLDLGMWEKDLGPGFTAAYSIGKLATISVAWFDIFEASDGGKYSSLVGRGADTSDAYYYSATALVAPIDGLQINLMGAYEVVGKNTPSGVKNLPAAKTMSDGTQYMVGAWVKGKFGQIGISGIAQYASYSGKVAGAGQTTKGFSNAAATQTNATKMEGSGYALNLSPSFNIDSSTTIAIFGTYISGNKNSADGSKPTAGKKDGSWWDACIDAQGFGHKMILFEDCGCCANLDTTNASYARVRAKGLGQELGYTLVGATATTKIGIYSPTFQVAYGMLNEKVKNTKMKKDLGTEFDLLNAFKISDATTFNLEFAYLLTGDAYKSFNVASGYVDPSASQKVQNASSIAAGMTQKF